MRCISIIMLLSFLKPFSFCHIVICNKKTDINTVVLMSVFFIVKVLLLLRSLFAHLLCSLVLLFNLLCSSLSLFLGSLCSLSLCLCVSLVTGSLGTSTLNSSLLASGSVHTFLTLNILLCNLLSINCCGESNNQCEHQKFKFHSFYIVKKYLALKNGARNYYFLTI